jgi:hypothetical protein
MAAQGRIAGPNPQNESVHICGLTPFLRVGFIPHWSKQNWVCAILDESIRLTADPRRHSMMARPFPPPMVPLCTLATETSCAAAT